MITPDRQDYVAAGDIRNDCRRHGIQTGTIDALLAEICIRHGLVMLSTDQDFRHMAARTNALARSLNASDVGLGRRDQSSVISCDGLLEACAVERYVVPAQPFGCDGLLG